MPSPLLTVQEAARYVEEIDARAPPLSAWEEEFMVSIRGRVQAGIPLTPLQSDTLREIAQHVGLTPLGLTTSEEDLWKE